MRNLKLAMLVLVAGAVSAGAAAAVPGHIGGTARLKPLLTQGACPPGYHWEAEGYNNGKYRPAHCAKD